MGKRHEAEAGRQRLLSKWEPPQESGKPIGVLATTFTLDTALFEEECLARFAGVQSDPDRDGALYRIEREEKLANVLSASVVADIHHCRGRRSLRWDLLGARTESGVMHAKISLLAWERHVRVLIASANLTVAGYRSNQECFAALDFTHEATDRGLLDSILAYLREILTLTQGIGRQRAESLLDWVDRETSPTIVSTRGLQRRLVLIGPGRPDFFTQIADSIKGFAPATEAHVVSPFFDKNLGDRGPERKLWELMKQRGEAQVHFHLAAEPAPEIGGWRLFAPAHLLDATPGNRSQVRTSLHPVRITEVPSSTGKENRSLHAKSLLLGHESWKLLCVGSSNFTSAGTGLQPYARNYEANVVFIAREGDDSCEALHARFLHGETALESTKVVQYEPPIDADGENEEMPPALPVFFSEVLLLGRSEEAYRIGLRFSPTTGVAPAWQVLDEQRVLVRQADWQAKGMPAELEIPIPANRPPPSALRVCWGDGMEADWPVTAVSAEVLPAPEELQGLSLAALLDLLSSARPLSDSLRRWLRRQPSDDDDPDRGDVELIDPHAKVDTSHFLMRRVERACWAMVECARRLAEPTISSSALSWRLHGPVGAVAVLDAIREQCDPILKDEWAFLLCEFLTELRRVRLTGLATNAVREDCERMYRKFVTSVEDELKSAGGSVSDALKSYIASAQEMAHG